ncbi:unnamed protein product [Absidia cylindrospora]
MNSLSDQPACLNVAWKRKPKSIKDSPSFFVILVTASALVILLSFVSNLDVSLDLAWVQESCLPWMWSWNQESTLSPCIAHVSENLMVLLYIKLSL